MGRAASVHQAMPVRTCHQKGAGLPRAREADGLGYLMTRLSKFMAKFAFSLYKKRLFSSQLWRPSPSCMLRLP